MAKIHAQKPGREGKGDPSKTPTSVMNGQATKPKLNHAIPLPEDGGHAPSTAAHLGGRSRDHTKPPGDLRHYEQEREPPMEVSRAGKDYRRQ